MSYYIPDQNTKTLTVSELKKLLNMVDNEDREICYSCTQDGSPVCIKGIELREELVVIK